MAGKNSWSYDATTLALIIHLRVAVSTTPSSEIALTIQLVDSSNCSFLSSSLLSPLASLLAFSLTGSSIPFGALAGSMVQQDLYTNFLRAGETPSRITSKPETAMDELAHF